MLVLLIGEVQFVLRPAWFLGWWFWLVPVLVGLCCAVAFFSVSGASIFRLCAGAFQVWLPLCM